LYRRRAFIWRENEAQPIIMRSDGADETTSSCEDEEAAGVVTVDPQKVPRCEMRVTLITFSTLQEHVQ